MQFHLILIFLLALLSSNVCVAEILKCVDKEGTVDFMTGIVTEKNKERCKPYSFYRTEVPPLNWFTISGDECVQSEGPANSLSDAGCKVNHEDVKNGKPVLVKIKCKGLWGYEFTTFFKTNDLCQKELKNVKKISNRLKREREAREKKKNQYLDKYR